MELVAYIVVGIVVGGISAWFIASALSQKKSSEQIAQLQT